MIEVRDNFLMFYWNGFLEMWKFITVWKRDTKYIQVIQTTPSIKGLTKHWDREDVNGNSMPELTFEKQIGVLGEDKLGECTEIGNSLYNDIDLWVWRPLIS